jgi:hypothetical protein
MTKQYLSKVGVFALIVINLGAYYVFWPDTASRGPGPENAEKAGKSAALAANASAAQPGDPWKPSMPSADPILPDPAKKDPLLTPPAPEVNTSKPPIPPARLAANQDSKGSNALPPIPDPGPPAIQPVGLIERSGPEPPPPSAPPVDPTKEQLKRLVETFKKGPPPAGQVSDPAAPSKRAPGFPAELPKDATVPSEPPAPRQADSSPWSLQWELADGHTLLIARLNKRLEFRIECERVKMESPDGAVLAIGKVSFIGPGVKGTCQQLTIGLAGDILVLDGKAQIQVQQGNPSDLAIPTVELAGERVSVRLQQLTGGAAPQAFPGAPTPSSAANAAPSPFTVAPLGSGKGR